MTAGRLDIAQGKAMALVAYVLDMASSVPVDREMVDRLVDEVCTDENERVRLISVAANSQDPEVPIHLLELLGRRLSRLREDHAREMDRDEVIGVWGQRLAASGLAASIGFAATGILSGGLGALAVAGAVVAAGVVTKGRNEMKRRARIAARASDETERLIDLIGRTRPMS